MKDKPSSLSRRRAHAVNGNTPDYSAKRAEMVRVAAEVFYEKGYASATLNDVAAKVGTDRASLYYYFASKEELFKEVVTGPVVANLQRAEAIVARDISPREKIQQLITVLIESQVEHYPDTHVYMQEDMHRAGSQNSEWAKTMAGHTHRMERLFIDTIAAGVEDGTFRDDLSNTLIANSLFGMTQWTHRWWVPESSRYDAADLIRVFSSVFLDGIDAHPRRTRKATKTAAGKTPAKGTKPDARRTRTTGTAVESTRGTPAKAARKALTTKAGAP
jgi:AcrR family transcriptional regulator